MIYEITQLIFLMESLKFVGIRRENKSVWERRTPLTPRDIREIMDIHPDIRFICQPSKLRIYSDSEYQAVGVTILEDLSPCNLIVGIKEVPLKEILPNTTYLIFSHVIKVPMLQNRPNLRTWTCSISLSVRG